MNEFIYIIECDKFIKVGITANIKRRVSALRTANPFEINLFDSIEIPGGYIARSIEKAAHDDLKSKGFHHKLEWFYGLTPSQARCVVFDCVLKASKASLLLSIKSRMSDKNKNKQRFLLFVSCEKKINKLLEKKTMTIEQIKSALSYYNLTKVARASGVDRHVLYRVVKENAKPSYETVKKLSDWLEGPQQ